VALVGYCIRDDLVKIETLRVAFFPDSYHEVDGVANTSRHFEAFARLRGLPFLVIHAGPRNEIVTSGSVTRIQVTRSAMTFPLDGTHQYDLLFLRHYREVARLVRDFDPHVVQITGPGDVGTLGAMLAHRLGVTLAASWQTNLHQYARSRVFSALSGLPKAWLHPLLDLVERWSFRATARFYKIPRVLFAPNEEMVKLLKTATGKPCFLMSHSVDTAVFSPEFRDRQGGVFTIGYVGRLAVEKNVRWLARLERALLAMGHRDFRIVVVGQGAEQRWLRENMRLAEFTGLLTGKDLSRAFGNMDVLAFPSETDTFGLVVLEALASGVPAVVTSRGGPKYTVQTGKTGYVTHNFDEFVASVALLLTRPDLLSSMRTAARQYALSTSWEPIFESMYKAYEPHVQVADVVGRGFLDVAKT
jgi:phosphatidylinositol alpha 1,6-mannosyltransferase